MRWLQERGVKIWNEWEISETGEYQGRNINKIYPNGYHAVHNFCQYPRTNTGKRRIFDTWSNTYRYGEWALVR